MDYKALYNFLYETGRYLTPEDTIHEGIVARYDEVIGLLNNGTKKNHIDIGCSYGKTIEFFMDKGFESCGVDPALTVCTHINQKHNKELAFEASATDLSMFKDRQFQILTSTDVIEHIMPAQMDFAIGEICRICSDFMYVRISKIPEHHKTDLASCPVTGVTELHVSVEQADYYIQKFKQNNFEVVSTVDIFNFVDLVMKRI